MDIKTCILTVVQGYDIIFEDEDEGSIGQEGHNLEKNENFAEETVPNFSDRQFKEHFRMSPETFENLLGKMHSVANNHVAVGHPEIALEKQILITLWCLANIESFRSVGDRFGISKATCWYSLYRTCHKILAINGEYKIISWPSRQRAVNIMESFQTANGFEGVIGCIDGTHIKILAPKDHPNSYCNRKNFHSILLQGVCDHRKLFTHVYTGEPGSIHDNRLFEKSDLSLDIEAGLVQFPNESHLLGDMAYKLKEYLIVGFKDNGLLTDTQKNFNFKLSQTRVAIENCFCLLKGRFRRLKYMETVRLDLISLLIMSACILHNLCILNGDEADDIINFDQEFQEERQFNNENYIDQVDFNNRRAIEKRNRIMNNLRVDHVF